MCRAARHAATLRRTSTTTAPTRSRKSSITTSSSSSECEVNAAALGVVPPAASTDGVNFDREPLPEERAALLAYLRKL